MEIGKQFNLLNVEEYFFYIDNYKKYTNFNTLGLYRSIIENDKLDVQDKIRIRDYANKIFLKTFEFLQIKDPKTFFNVTTIGQELTSGDVEQLWKKIIVQQEKILADKKIKHRNFGVYSKHNCGQEDCIYNGLMLKQGSSFLEMEMHFYSDKSKWNKKVKSEKRKLDRKNENQIIDKKIELE
ncbi:hypothetical protein IR010_13175 [Flavobacterium sp. MR2016-29]|uniref:hypothetical protein n=1 Tax=Flavobacterium sp. MR2016-29 TaxID=2783795 RepID=UPI00188BB031|nr:hypothetical protein [Flavobacterium sp. MR2016-29]MBF4493493.1 hypothetical protein [Flavobacterium sp. MR2016-29]